MNMAFRVCLWRSKFPRVSIGITNSRMGTKRGLRCVFVASESW